MPQHGRWLSSAAGSRGVPARSESAPGRCRRSRSSLPVLGAGAGGLPPPGARATRRRCTFCRRWSFFVVLADLAVGLLELRGPADPGLGLLGVGPLARLAASLRAFLNVLLEAADLAARASPPRAVPPRSCAGAIRSRRSAACSARTLISSCTATTRGVGLDLFAAAARSRSVGAAAAVERAACSPQVAQLALARHDAGLGVVRADRQGAVRFQQLALAGDEAISPARWRPGGAGRSRTMSVRPAAAPAGRRSSGWSQVTSGRRPARVWTRSVTGEPGQSHLVGRLGRRPARRQGAGKLTRPENGFQPRQARRPAARVADQEAAAPAPRGQVDQRGVLARAVRTSATMPTTVRQAPGRPAPAGRTPRARRCPGPRGCAPAPPAPRSGWPGRCCAPAGRRPLAGLVARGRARAGRARAQVGRPGPAASRPAAPRRPGQLLAAPGRATPGSSAACALRAQPVALAAEVVDLGLEADRVVLQPGRGLRICSRCSVLSTSTGAAARHAVDGRRRSSSRARTACRCSWPWASAACARPPRGPLRSAAATRPSARPAAAGFASSASRSADSACSWPSVVSWPRSAAGLGQAAPPGVDRLVQPLQLFLEPSASASHASACSACSAARPAAVPGPRLGLEPLGQL